METFTYKKNKFSKIDFSNLEISEIVKGPYVIRFKSEGIETNMYFCGDDEKLHARLLSEGKLVLHMAKFFDLLNHFSVFVNDDVRNIRKFGEYIKKINVLSSYLKNHSTFRDLENYSNKEVDSKLE